MTLPERSNERTALDEILFILRRLNEGKRARVWLRLWACGLSVNDPLHDPKGVASAMAALERNP